MSNRKASPVIKQNKQFIRTLSSVVLLLILTGCGSSNDSAKSGISIKAGEAISFSQDITGGKEDGWSLPDSGGTWSQSKRATLKLNYGSEFANGMNLSLKTMGFVSNKEQATRVVISANGVEVKKIDFSSNQPNADISLNIPKEILSSNKSQLVLSFDTPSAVSPKDLGLSEDVRKLGIFLIELSADKK